MVRCVLLYSVLVIVMKGENECIGAMHSKSSFPPQIWGGALCSGGKGEGGLHNNGMTESVGVVGEYFCQCKHGSSG